MYIYVQIHLFEVKSTLERSLGCATSTLPVSPVSVIPEYMARYPSGHSAQVHIYIFKYNVNIHTYVYVYIYIHVYMYYIHMNTCNRMD